MPAGVSFMCFGNLTAVMLEHHLQLETSTPELHLRKPILLSLPFDEQLSDSSFLSDFQLKWSIVRNSSLAKWCHFHPAYCQTSLSYSHSNRCIFHTTRTEDLLHLCNPAECSHAWYASIHAPYHTFIYSRL